MKYPTLPYHLDARRKLSDADKIKAKQMLDNGIKREEVARTFNVSSNAIRRAVVLTDAQRKEMKKKHYLLYNKPREKELHSKLLQAGKKSRSKRMAFISNEIRQYLRDKKLNKNVELWKKNGRLWMENHYYKNPKYLKKILEKEPLLILIA